MPAVEANSRTMSTTTLSHMGDDEGFLERYLVFAVRGQGRAAVLVTEGDLEHGAET